MKDTNGNIIKVGDTVKTVQPSGGILKPAPPVIGEVIITPKEFRGTYRGNLFLRYKKSGKDFYSYIDLDGKINTII